MILDDKNKDWQQLTSFQQMGIELKEPAVKDVLERCSYDKERRLFLVSEEDMGRIMWLIKDYCGLKHKVEEMGDKLRISIPVRTIMRKAVRALRKNPKDGQRAFEQDEDMIDAFSEANGGSCQKEVEEMERVAAELRLKQELGETRKNEFNVTDYHDSSITSERHYHIPENIPTT